MFVCLSFSSASSDVDVEEMGILLLSLTCILSPPLPLYIQTCLLPPPPQRFIELDGGLFRGLPLFFLGENNVSERENLDRCICFA